mmetsp:Transcript_3634/g.8618  ORF Transcript_3634/g.8618 Transcript_3634/m.8618 type:complete len:83 (-) Transcript_3634:552-800(-)
MKDIQLQLIFLALGSFSFACYVALNHSKGEVKAIWIEQYVKEKFGFPAITSLMNLSISARGYLQKSHSIDWDVVEKPTAEKS